MERRNQSRDKTLRSIINAANAKKEQMREETERRKKLLESQYKNAGRGRGMRHERPRSRDEHDRSQSRPLSSTRRGRHHQGSHR